MSDEIERSRMKELLKSYDRLMSSSEYDLDSTKLSSSDSSELLQDESLALENRELESNEGFSQSDKTSYVEELFSNYAPKDLTVSQSQVSENLALEEKKTYSEWLSDLKTQVKEENPVIDLTKRLPSINKKAILLSSAAGVLALSTLIAFIGGFAQELFAKSDLTNGFFDKSAFKLATIGSLRHRKSRKFSILTSGGYVYHPTDLWNRCQLQRRLKVDNVITKVVDFDMYPDRFEILFESFDSPLILEDVIQDENTKFLFSDGTSRVYHVEYAAELAEVK